MVKYELTVKMDISEEMEFQEIERMVVEESRRAGREVLEQILKAREEAELLKRRSLAKREERPKQYETLLGGIKLSRWKTRDRRGKSRYPLDEWMGLAPYQRVSHGLEEEIVTACVTKPYGQATADTNQVSGGKRSTMGNWRLIQGLGRRLKEERKVEKQRGKGLPGLRAGIEDPCPILAIDPDGTYIRARRKGETNHDVKMCVLYSLKTASGKREKRRHLEQKQVVVGLPNESAEMLFERTTAKAIADYGAHAKTRVVVHGDGDTWIKRCKNFYFPQALIRLDPYHAMKAITLATGVKDIPSDWRSDIYGDPDALTTKLSVFKCQFADEEDRIKVDRLIAYLSNNREGMLPSGVSKETKGKFPGMYTRGSGTIESNIFWAINQRFKRPRMSWSEGGVSNLLCLRESYLNKKAPFKAVKLPKAAYKPSAANALRDVIREHLT